MANRESMSSKWKRRALGGAALTLGTLVLAGCAEEREAINRTQPNALPKSFFVGASLTDTADDPEFYSQGTLVDVGYGSKQDGLFTSTYAQPMTRIKWVIQEDMLVARLAYERISGTDGKGAGAASRDGLIVAAFPITSHFDIRNAYNPATGEELNVIEENTSDRPWYEREYIRVDWSTNLNTDAYDLDTLSMLGIYGGLTYEPLAYNVTDPNHPDYPRADVAGGYLDVTNKAFAAPAQIDLSSLNWGMKSFPACMLPADVLGGSAPEGNCNPVELTIRQSFRRIENTDYEPLEWDGHKFQAYGAFYTERFGYDRGLGMVDQQWHRMISRYNIWERSHYYADPVSMTGAIECHEASDPCDKWVKAEYAAKELPALGGSTCDVFSQKCTLPYRARTMKPFAWYYGDGSDPEYFDPTFEATHQWDIAIRTGVRVAQHAECLADGGKAQDCDTKYPMYHGQQSDNEAVLALSKEVDDCRAGRAYANLGRDEAACTALAGDIGKARGYNAGVISVAQMPELLTLCHSPVLETDSKTHCAATGTVARRGDLRFHLVNVLTEPQTPSPWGIYVDAHDPLTGETVNASINVWSHINDLWSKKIIDAVRLTSGAADLSQISPDATDMADWSATATSASAGHGALGRLSAAQVDTRLAAAADMSVEALRDLRAADLEAPVRDFATAVMQRAKDIRFDQTRGQWRTTYEARMESARGTAVESELMNLPMQQLAGVQDLPLTGLARDLASPFRAGARSVQRELTQFKEMALAERGACMLQEAPAPMAMVRLGSVLTEKFGDLKVPEKAEAARQYIARQSHFAVILHEMGHSIGMRHNFVSSSDAWNYRPQYWALRTENGKSTAECTDQVADGKRCVGPRYFDPVTQTESDNMLWMFMHSSVMDYAGEPTQDLMGLGAYDFAAARMFYGQSVAVYQSATPALVGAVKEKIDSFGGFLGIPYTDGGPFWGLPSGKIHYSQLQSVHKLMTGCKAIANIDAFKPARWNEGRDGVWNPLLDAQIIKIDGQYLRCGDLPTDYSRWADLETNTFVTNKARQVRVPYGFATDSWADLGNVAVYRHDNGADPYEIYDFLLTQQEVWHPFDNYRRGRQTFSVSGAANRALTRYNEKMRDGAKGLAVLKNVARDMARNQVDIFNNPDPEGTAAKGWATLVDTWIAGEFTAASLVFDHFTNSMTRPHSGDHGYSTDLYGARLLVPGDMGERGGFMGGPMVVPNGAVGGFGDFWLGGRPLHNALGEDATYGEYSTEYTLSAGYYYDKIYSTMLLTESADNFVSRARSDFYDGRGRANSMADLFGDGYRRWIGSILTGDSAVSGSRVVAVNKDGVLSPKVGAGKMPVEPIARTVWWTEAPSLCMPKQGLNTCAFWKNGAWEFDGRGLGQDETLMTIDPQVGWEQQKFAIAWTLLYLPENEKSAWVDSFRIWEMGADADPGGLRRVELHTPTRTYVALSQGKEELFGRLVEKGIGARVLQWANELMKKSYATADGPDLDGDHKPDWVVPVLDEKGNLKYLDNNGRIVADATECQSSACLKFEDYLAVPAFIRQTMDAYGYRAPDMRGIFE